MCSFLLPFPANMRPFPAAPSHRASLHRQHDPIQFLLKTHTTISVTVEHKKLDLRNSSVSLCCGWPSLPAKPTPANPLAHETAMRSKRGGAWAFCAALGFHPQPHETGIFRSNCISVTGSKIIATQAPKMRNSWETASHLLGMYKDKEDLDKELQQLKKKQAACRKPVLVMCPSGVRTKDVTQLVWYYLCFQTWNRLELLPSYTWIPEIILGMS